jgi:hypothetical protein
MGAPGIEAGEGDDRPRLTGADFVWFLQGFLGGAEGPPFPLDATRFDSALGQIRDIVRAVLPPARAAGASLEGGPAPAAVALAQLLRDLAELLDAGDRR